MPVGRKYILEAEIAGHPDVEPTVRGVGGARHLVTVYIRADAELDEG